VEPARHGLDAGTLQVGVLSVHGGLRNELEEDRGVVYAAERVAERDGEEAELGEERRGGNAVLEVEERAAAEEAGERDAIVGELEAVVDDDVLRAVEAELPEEEDDLCATADAEAGP